MRIVKYLRGAGWTLLIAATVLVALFLAVLAVNLFDEHLTPAAGAILAPPADPVPPGQNLFVSMAGLQAPAGESPAEAGARWLSRQQEKFDQFDRAHALASLHTATERAPAALEFSGEVGSCCAPETSLWLDARTHGAEIGTLMAQNAELHRRYLDLHALHAYVEPERLALFVPMPFVPRPLETLYLANLALRLQSGAPEQARAAIDDLAADMAMWRTVIRGRSSILAAMLANASLRTDLQLLGNWVADPRTRLDELAPGAAKALMPWAIGEWKMGSAYSAEMRVRAPVLRELKYANGSPPPGRGNGSWWSRAYDSLGVYLLKLNATENLEAEDTLELKALADGDPRDFIERRGRYRAWREKHLSRLSIGTLYNPFGRILLSAPNPYDEYPLRLYDVAAFQRLVYLVYELRVLGVKAADVPAFIANHPEWSAHPVTGAPCLWDPANATLGVATLAPESKPERFKVTLAWLAAAL